MVIWSLSSGQLPLVILHSNTLLPELSPVTGLFGLLGSVTTAFPATTIQLPVPAPGALAVKTASPLHTEKSSPAAAASGGKLRVMVTSSNVAGQETVAAMVHLKTLAPAPSPIIELFGLLGSEIVPDPETTVQVPVPVVG
jgi:hypothetical protein